MDLKTPSLSLIVPVYNVEEYLAECLNSIINQTLKDIEIICVNDGSLDGSVTILEEFQRKDNRIIIITKENGGLSSARNVGMKVAKGEYIGFVDSDDWIDYDFFEKLFLIAKKHSAEMAMGNTEYYLSNNANSREFSFISNFINNIKPEIIESVQDRKKIIGTCVVWNKIFLREFLNRNSLTFYEGLFWEDNPFTIISSIKSNRIGLVREVFYHCRKHDKSITGSASFDKKPFDIFKIFSRLKISFDSENIPLMEDYRYYYEDILFFHYSDHLINRVHKSFKKEFYYRVQKEFRNLNEGSIIYMSNKYPMFRLIKSYNYTWFKIINLFKIFNPFIIFIFNANYKFYQVLKKLIKQKT